MDALKKIFGQSIWNYIAAVVLAVAVGVFRFVMLPKGIHVRFIWYEVLSVSGIVTFLFGALLMVAYLGAFDLFGYVFSPGRISGRQKYKNYTEYAQKKEQNRAKEGYFFVPYFLVGVIVVLISCFLD